MPGDSMVSQEIMLDVVVSSLTPEPGIECLEFVLGPSEIGAIV